MIAASSFAQSNLLNVDNATPINIETVIKLVSQNNQKIAEFKAKHDLAIAKHAKTKEWFLPNVYAGLVSWNHSGYDITTEGDFIDVKKNYTWLGAGFKADWKLGDAMYKGIAAKQFAEAASFATEAEREKQLALAISIYYDLAAAQARLLVNRDLLDKNLHLVNQLDLQVENGMRYKSDLLLAMANLNHLKIEASKAENAIKQASNDLLYILSVKENTLFVSVDSVFVPVDIVNAQTLAKIEDAESKRPKVLQLESTINALETARKSVGASMMMPNLTVGFNDGMYGPTFNFMGTQNRFNFGVKWNFPLGTLLYNGDRKQFDAKIYLNKVRLEDAGKQIRKEVLSAYYDVLDTKKQVDYATKGVGYATEAFQQSLERQKIGTAIPLEVIHAQEKLMIVKLDYIQSVLSHNKAQYRLHIALGNKL
ncbi:TolC family protein [Cytophagaceae bacterium AH-315-L13]|nr:TolC family protein [Cytophagaceae bacterium AH-315-L13]